MLELQHNRAVARLREANEEVLFGPSGGEMAINPCRQERRRKSLVVDRCIDGVVGVPRVDRERGLDNREVVVVLCIEFA